MLYYHEILIEKRAEQFRNSPRNIPFQICQDTSGRSFDIFVLSFHFFPPYALIVGIKIDNKTEDYSSLIALGKSQFQLSFKPLYLINTECVPFLSLILPISL
jgi:hypothetical protein